MKKLKEVLENKINGMYYGNRILLPFKAEILKAIIESNTVTDFSDFSEQAEYNIKDTFTEIYFYEYEDLSDFISAYETIKFILVEEGDDVFNKQNHKKIILHVKENHVIEIEEAGGDTIFFD
ncbi:MAG: hypothetical protein F9K45_05890 [Melioribacteraceae bacterium]|nr:MAG: hypothetical protein F9K45_05890 [Melioribacteraceae bacterium]